MLPAVGFAWAAQVTRFLVGRDIPGDILRLPEEVLATPFGAMLRPMLQSMGGGGPTVDPFAIAGPSPFAAGSGTAGSTATARGAGGRGGGAAAAAAAAAPSLPPAPVVPPMKPLLSSDAGAVSAVISRLV